MQALNDYVILKKINEDYSTIGLHVTEEDFSPMKFGEVVSSGVKDPDLKTGRIAIFSRAAAEDFDDDHVYVKYKHIKLSLDKKDLTDQLLKSILNSG